MVYIGIEDLAANALIELIERYNKREVLFRELDDYGALVVKVLNQRGDQAVLILSKERTTEFFRDYSDYFELFSAGKDDGIRLKEKVTSNALWEKFRGYLSINALLAFMDKDAVAVLKVSA